MFETIDAGVAARPRAWLGWVVVAMMVVPAASALRAQTPSAAALAASAAGLEPNERARRDADKVYRMILMQSDKPRRSIEGKALSDREASARSRKAPESSPAAGGASRSTPAATAAVKGATPERALPSAMSTDSADASATASTAPVSARLDAEAAPKPGLHAVIQVEPQFGAEVMRSLGKGQVDLRFAVRADGTVADPEVVASTDARLNAPALRAIAMWRFAPLPESITAQVRLEFSEP